MASFMTDLWESIFTPGPTPSILKATNASFASLQIVLLLLLYGTRSVHFIILSVLCAGLWWSINWFASELRASQEREKAAAKEAGAAAAADDESDTEVEAEAQVVGTRGGKRNAEPLEVRGEMRHRGGEEGATTGTQSSVSTEDEWEKVSESEQEKDKEK